jgi:hypothetical protein
MHRKRQETGIWNNGARLGAPGLKIFWKPPGPQRANPQFAPSYWRLRFVSTNHSASFDCPASALALILPFHWNMGGLFLQNMGGLFLQNIGVLGGS